MRILCVTPFDPSGYGTAGTDIALALDACGAEVVCRRLVLNDAPYRPPARLAELLARPHRRPYDASLQVMLPQQMRPHGDIPAAGYFYAETDHFRSTSWRNDLNRLDAVVCPAGNTRDACVASGVTVPLHLVPTPVDVRRYERHHEPLPALAPGGVFRFYSVGEFVRRKDYESLLSAYYGEFRRSEGVHLVLKLHRGGVPNAELQAEFARWNLDLKRRLKLHTDPERYPPVTLVTQAMTDEEMMRLHASCDVFVSASHGEGWGRPAFDAMALGKTPIVPGHTGYSAWADESVGWVVPSSPQPCSGAVDSLPDLYRADETWFQVDIGGLRAAMRAAFRDRDGRVVKARAGLERAYHFGYEAVGPRLLEVLASCGKHTGPI